MKFSTRRAAAVGGPRCGDAVDDPGCGNAVSLSILVMNFLKHASK